ncbi:hypothetical protein N431DRAFT_463896 [Stipitochalara longipes BDJ]|nr:hypothetical protein N431DRAFT_463896 [Stipitochalara longipes BDJ]
MAISKDVADELRRMARHWGMLTTREQIENISDYHNDIVYEKDDRFKEQAYQIYLNKDGKDKFHRRRCEIALYRVTGEISTFFLDMDAGLDYLMVDKVLSIAEEWRFLESEGLLPLLDDFDIIQEVENQSPPRSRAEILRRFMHFYKARYIIEDWTTENLDVLRRQLFKVRRDARCWRHRRDAQDSSMPPPKKVKSDNPKSSQTEEFDEDRAHRKLINFRHFAENTYETYKEADKLLIREVERLLEGVRGAQKYWTPQSALAQAAAFKRFGLQVEKLLGNKLFFALESVYNSRAEMDEIAQQLRRRKSLSSSSSLTDLSDVVGSWSQAEKDGLAQQLRRKSMSETSTLTDRSSVMRSRSMKFNEDMPAFEPDTSALDKTFGINVANFISISSPTKRKYISPYDKRIQNKRSLIMKNEDPTSNSGAAGSVLRPSHTLQKVDRKLMIKVCTINTSTTIALMDNPMKRRREEKEDLKRLLGKFEEPKQIARAVHYDASLRNSEDDRIKAQALSKYISTVANGLHARAEMQIYRMMGDTSNLGVWAFLAMAGGLCLFLEHKDIDRVYSSGGSAAEVFRAFLDVQKAKGKFERWNQEHMNEVLFTIHEVVKDFQNGISAATTPGNSLTSMILAHVQADEHAEKPLAKKAKFETKPDSQARPGQATDLKSSIEETSSEGQKPSSKPCKQIFEDFMQGTTALLLRQATMESETISGMRVEKAKAMATKPKESWRKYQVTVESDDEDSSQSPSHPKPDIRENQVQAVDVSSAEHVTAKETRTTNPKAQGTDTQDQSIVGSESAELAKSKSRSKMPKDIVPSTALSAHDIPRESTPLERFSAKFNKIEASLKVAEKNQAETKVAFETAKDQAAEAYRSLDSFETRHAKNSTIFSSAFRDFGMDKRRQLLAVQVPIHEEEKARKKFEDTKMEYEKWTEKMELLNQAVEAFEVD